MKCPEIHQHVAEYLYNELPADKSEQVAQHLSTCEACRRELQQLSAVQKWLSKTETSEAAGPRLHSATILRRAWETSERSRRQWRRALYGVAAAAACALVVWLTTTRVEIQRSQITIAWGRQMPAPPTLSLNDLSRKDLESLAGSLAAHDSRLEELEKLTRLLEQVTDAEHRNRLHELIALESELRTIALRNDTRWNTVTQVFRRGVPGDESPVASNLIVDGDEP